MNSVLTGDNGFGDQGASHFSSKRPGNDDVLSPGERDDQSYPSTSGNAPVRDYKFAEYFERKVLHKRPYLRKEWCIAVVERPTRSEPQGDSRYRFWAPIPELGGRYLRVITLADKVTILNAFPDRGIKP
jgi:hypothetical protein